MMRIIYLLLAFAVSLFAFAPSASPVDDRAGFFSEKERATFEEFTRELYSRFIYLPPTKKLRKSNLSRIHFVKAVLPKILCGR